eukprot:scaffold26903_cov129-Isochrysis_galbana.AAC.5
MLCAHGRGLSGRHGASTRCVRAASGQPHQVEEECGEQWNVEGQQVLRRVCRAQGAKRACEGEASKSGRCRMVGIHIPPSAHARCGLAGVGLVPPPSPFVQQAIAGMFLGTCADPRLRGSRETR